MSIAIRGLGCNWPAGLVQELVGGLQVVNRSGSTGSNNSFPGNFLIFLML